MEAATARLKELKAALAEARQENCNIRGYFEYYQQRIAKDRQREREDTQILT